MSVALGPQSTGLGKMVQEPRARFKVAKWRVFCHSAGLQNHPARFKQFSSDSTLQWPLPTKMPELCGLSCPKTRITADSKRHKQPEKSSDKTNIGGHSRQNCSNLARDGETTRFVAS